MTKSALITGGSGGIGLGVAEGLARRGWNLTVAARGAERLGQASTCLRQAGASNVLALVADVADDEQRTALVEAHRDAYGGAMDALVLNAGVGTAGMVETYPRKRLHRTFDVNLLAPFLLLQDCVSMLRRAAASDPQRGARVIVMSSITGVFAEPGLAVYGASKAALLSLVSSINQELSVEGITATALSPGYVDTEMSAWVHDRIPAEAMMTVEDIVTMVLAILDLSSRAVVSNIVMSRSGTDGFHA